MKKNFMKTALVAIFCLAVGYTTYNAQNKNENLSDMILDNVEALAGESSGGDCQSYCSNSGNGCILVYTNGTRVTCSGRWK